MAEIKPHNQTNSHDVGDIEQTCRHFEAQLRKGEQVDIDACLQGWEEPERSRLLSELISIEIRSRHHGGRPVQIQDFLERFPHDNVVVHEAFADHHDDQTVLPSVLHDQLNTESQLKHLRFLAEGGLGQVFIAEDAKLRRDAAVKLIREDLINDTDSCEQFRIEAEVTGRLAHPGIPIVYAIGETNKGRLFYAMQYVRGTRLDKLIRRHHKEFNHEQGSQWFGLRRLKLNSIRKTSSIDSGSHSHDDSHPTDSSAAPALDLRELMGIFISVCHTIGYAHRRGILHRDIKPSNVIHGKFGETIVIDWGLALPVARQGVFKDVAEQTIAPRSGKGSRLSVGCVGTPAFMSPEQARGDVPLTPASDIFALGTLLYTILTGVPPFQGQSVSEVRQHAIDCEFAPPKSLIKQLPDPLEAICLKAMRAQVSERYRTTHELVADIREYLSDRPVSAYRDSPYRKLSRWMRHNTQIVLAAMLAVLLVASSVGLLGLSKSLALLREQKSSLVQKQGAENEKMLREKSLMMAADLAARTLANKIDIIYRALELCSRDEVLQSSLKGWNQSQDKETMTSIQSWLDHTVSLEPPTMQFRSWFVMGSDGTYLARTPEFSNGKRSASIGKNFAFRDYFHGLGQDFPPSTPAPPPLKSPHNSAALFSTMDTEMTVSFSVPIVDSTKQSIGALCVVVECKEFGDLELEQSGDQQLILVEGRGYPMLQMEWSDESEGFVVNGAPQWSAGILLHHQSPLYRPEFSDLPRVSNGILRFMMQDRQPTVGNESTRHNSAKLFSETIYVDPIQNSDDEHWLAAFRPVQLDTRADANVADTGWFVIVQQKMVRLTE